MIVFAVKAGKKYLQGFNYNERYKKSIRSIGYQPHSEEEFTAIWGDAPKYYDTRTLRGYLDTLFENRRWGHEKFSKLTILTGEE